MDPASWISDAWWSYGVIALVISGSAIFPPLPSESMLITAIGLSLSGQLEPVPAALAAGMGSLGGDSVAYTLGRVAAGRREPRPGGRVASALAWVERREDSWLPALIVGGRFVPGGTTAIGVGCGAMRFSMPRFAVLALLGAAVWVGYGFMLAAAGQAASPDNPWVGIGFGLVLVLVVAGAVSLGHHLHQRHGGR